MIDTAKIHNKTYRPSANGGILPLSRVLSVGRGAFILTALFLSAVYPPFALGNDKAQPQGVEVNSQRLADAIYLAEGGKKTRYPYGIKSIHCEGENACRQICINTINNNKKRFLKQSKYKDYIEFLGSRYCPLNIKGEYHLNKNWVRNVKHFYQKGGAK